MKSRRVKLEVATFDPAKYKAGRIPAYDRYARATLERCDAMWNDASGLDTAVRDSVAQGIAYIVASAFDSQACSLGIEGLAFHTFTEAATAEWFRERGCAEWFCLGAAALFNCSRPRTLAERKEVIKFRRSPGKKKRVA